MQIRGIGAYLFLDFDFNLELSLIKLLYFMHDSQKFEEIFNII